MTPPAAGAEFAAVLDPACRAGDVAAVLIWGAEPTLVAAAQGAGAAALLRGDPGQVGALGADGFHMDAGTPDPAAALALRPDRIVGAGDLRSRHDAMIAGERGADYVLFGSLTPGETRGNAPALLLERAAWWQEIFEIPCVAYAPTLDLVGPLAVAGADFVALREAVWDAPVGPEAALSAAMRAIAAARDSAGVPA